jgi:hypothetical protein
MSPAAQGVIRRLDEARQRWWLFTLLTSAVLATSLSLATLLVFMLSDALLKFHQFVLLGLFVVWLAVTIGLIVMVFRRMVRSQRTLEATARRVEAEFPELGSNLINLVQLDSDTKNENHAFCEAAVTQAAARIGHVRFEEAAAKESRWQRFVCCMQTPRDLGESFILLGVLVVAAVLCHLLIPNWGSAGTRLMTPWTFVPSVGAVKILSVTPGDTEVLVGASLEIAVEIENPDGNLYDAKLFVTPEGEKEAAQPMAADEEAKKKNTRYKATLASVLKPLKYRIEVGDSQSKVYSVGVCQKPTIEEVEVRLKYPVYLGKPEDLFMQKTADLEAPQYTEAELRIRPSVEIAKGHIEMEGKQYSGRVENDGHLLVVAKLPLVKDTSYTIHMFNTGGSDPNPRMNRIHVIPDKPPTVELVKPDRQTTAAPGGDVAVMVRAADDYGVGQVRLETKSSEPAAGQSEGEAQAPEVERPSPIEPKTWTKGKDFKGSKDAVLNYRLELGANKLKAGQTLLVRAVVTDERLVTDWGLNLDPQQTSGPWHRVRLIDEQAKTAAALEQLDNLRSAIWKILETQIRGRMRAATIVQKKELAERTTLAAEVRGIQVEVQKGAMALVQSIKDTDKADRLAIKRVVNHLALGDMLQAVQQCDEMVKVKALDGFAKSVPEVTATQDRIVETLRKLLDAARQAQTEVLAEAKKRPGGDLNEDSKKKLEEIKAKLDKFLEQQKKIMEASENLAKKPVEDFTEEEEKLLKALAASEDDWSKFMKELNTDLSKLPEQDFANGTMAKELVEIQTELKMAEDALLKKSADIAVPLEQLGYERAEEIKTNLEKWLPDTPDREKWSQEESLTDQDKEAPAAELPGELEDLIGELMEEEEDLMDEMEDVSSSAMDSLDKGAGWDVTDGPISNMSAKGATGNRLPNTSEIGGRAGEGRSAKSSGEFVGDEAVGKGGRKTPSRLTPDPYVKGQIKDHSKDPTGGATGGGKESGSGGEGLEGPSPNGRDPRDMERLAGKQAALRNKAESVDAQFEIAKFHHTDLKKMIELMSQIERDLKAGRYQNALRQKQVLIDGLGNVKQYMEGEFEVRKDATSSLPGDIQKDILGSMQDPSPAGWEEMNRQYFQRLSESGGGGGGAPAPSPKK